MVTEQQVYDVLNYDRGKTGFEIMKALRLEVTGLEKKLAGPFLGNIYLCLDRLLDQKLIYWRNRDLSEEELRKRGGVPRKEYLRTKGKQYTEEEPSVVGEIQTETA